MAWYFLALLVIVIYLAVRSSRISNGQKVKTPPKVWVDASAQKPQINHAPFPEHGSDHSSATQDDSDTVEIVGESHYQAALIELFGAYTVDGHSETCQAELVREPNNKFDKNAVRCEIQGKLVGYVNRDEAKDVAAHMKKKRLSKMTVAANINGGWDRGEKNRGMYGVTVELHPSVLATD